jgi:hypothetical protein
MCVFTVKGDQTMAIELVTVTSLLSWLKITLSVARKDPVDIQEARNKFSGKNVTVELWGVARAAMGPKFAERILIPSSAKVVAPVHAKKTTDGSKDDLTTKVCRVLSRQPWFTLDQVVSRLGEEVSKDTYGRAQVCIGGVNPFQKALCQDLIKAAKWLEARGISLDDMTPARVTMATGRTEGLRYVTAVRNNQFFRDLVKGNSPAPEPKYDPALDAAFGNKPAKDYVVVSRVTVEKGLTAVVVEDPQGNKVIEIRKMLPMERRVR